MPIDRREIEEARKAQLGTLPDRIMYQFEGDDKGYTAKELAARLLGFKNKYSHIFQPEVDEALPAVQQALGHLVQSHRLIVTTIQKPLGPEDYYSKPG